MPVSQSTSRGHIANEQSRINTSSGGSSHPAAVGCGRDRQVTAVDSTGRRQISRSNADFKVTNAFLHGLGRKRPPPRLLGLLICEVSTGHFSQQVFENRRECT